MRGRTWSFKCAVSEDADVGAVADGMQGPWCLERMVRVGDEVEDAPGARRGCSAMNATKGYVVACSFCEASDCDYVKA